MALSANRFGLGRFLYSVPLLYGFIAATAAGQVTCGDVQKRLDGVQASGYQTSYDTSWNQLEPIFGKATSNSQAASGATLRYDFSGCSAEFQIGSEGKIVSKRFKFGSTTVALSPTGRSESVTAGADLTISALQASIRQLDARLTQLEKLQQHEPP